MALSLYRLRRHCSHPHPRSVLEACKKVLETGTPEPASSNSRVATLAEPSVEPSALDSAEALAELACLPVKEEETSDLGLDSEAAHATQDKTASWVSDGVQATAAASRAGTRTQNSSTVVQSSVTLFCSTALIGTSPPDLKVVNNEKTEGEMDPELFQCGETVALGSPGNVYPDTTGVTTLPAFPLPPTQETMADWWNQAKERDPGAPSMISGGQVLPPMQPRSQSQLDSKSKQVVKIKGKGKAKASDEPSFQQQKAMSAGPSSVDTFVQQSQATLTTAGHQQQFHLEGSPPVTETRTEGPVRAKRIFVRVDATGFSNST